MVWSSYLDIVKVNDPILAADRDRTLFVGFILGLNFEVVIIIDLISLPRMLSLILWYSSTFGLNLPAPMVFIPALMSQPGFLYSLSSPKAGYNHTT